MAGFNFLIDPATKALGNFAISTAKAGAGKLASEVEKAFFQASRKYIETYQKRHCQLKVLGMREPVDLSAVYTGVKLLNERELLGFDPSALEETYRKTRLRGYTGRRDDAKYPGIEIANRKQYLMVLGGPGAGKSTFLRKVGLEALRTLYYEAADYRPRLIPVLLELKRFDAENIDVAKFIVREFGTCGFPQAEEFVQKALAQGNLLVLLDGLDEVPSANLDNVLNEIRDFVDRYDKNRFISSCRIAASSYRSRAFQRFSNVTMADFDDEQIEQFITNWFGSPQDIEWETAKKCWEVLQKPENKASKDLAHTPLLLTYLCLVYNQLQRFPNNRSSLYKKALRILLEEWAAEKRILRDDIYEDLSIEQEEILLSEIAYEGMMAEQLFFSKRELSKQIKDFLLGTLNVPASLDSEKVLNAIEVQQGILVERAGDMYSFSHLTLQEYLTAQCIIDNSKWKKLVQQKVTNAQWREVLRLLPGLMRGSTSDTFLLEMETKANTYLQNQKIRELVNWVDRTVDRDFTEEKLIPLTRRATILSLTLIFAYARSHTNILDFDYDLERALYLDRAHYPSRDLNLDRALDLAFDLNLEHAPDLFRDLANIFPMFSFNELVSKIEVVEREWQWSNREKRKEVIEEIHRFWFSTLDFKPEMGLLSRKESQSLTNYFYICELMIRCKEGAVRVSPDVWAGIESRILTVPPNAQSQQPEAAPS